MHTGTIPKTVVEFGNGKGWSFANSVEWLVNTNPVFNQSGAGTRVGARLVAALYNDAEEKKAGESYSWRDDDASLLADVVVPKNANGDPDPKAKGPAEGFAPQWSTMQFKVGPDGNVLLDEAGKPIQQLDESGKPVMTPISIPGRQWTPYIDAISPPKDGEVPAPRALPKAEPPANETAPTAAAANESVAA